MRGRFRDHGIAIAPAPAPWGRIGPRLPVRRSFRPRTPRDFAMSLSMHAAAMPAFLTTLGALSKILDKAAAHCAARKIDPAALLTMRLYPDMFTFTKQVQLTCDFAKNTVGRLTGEPPKFPDEEKSFDELKARIAMTVDYVKGFKPDDFHATTAYDILRHCGVELGKRDFLGRS